MCAAARAQNNVVPLMAMGVSSLKKELTARAFATGKRLRRRKGAARAPRLLCRRCPAAHVHSNMQERTRTTHNTHTQHTRAEIPEIHQFLDGFYLSRIGIRMLAGQHVALHEPPPPAHIGLICTACSPWQARRSAGGRRGPGRCWRPVRPCFHAGPHTNYHPPHTHTQVAHDAVSDARSICLREYGSAPDVAIYGDPNFTFPYVPSHLHHMVFELVGGAYPPHAAGWFSNGSAVLRGGCRGCVNPIPYTHTHAHTHTHTHTYTHTGEEQPARGAGPLRRRRRGAAADPRRRGRGRRGRHHQGGVRARVTPGLCRGYAGVTPGLYLGCAALRPTASTPPPPAQVSDEGGGIPRSGLPRIWSYLYSTAKSPVVLDDETVESGGPNVLAGYGYGLPIR